MGNFYGYDRPTMPHLADRGDHLLRFDEVYATGAWTGPTTASMATGLMSEHHGLLRIDTSTGEQVVQDPLDVPLLAATLQAGGWSTALISGNRWVSPVAGFDLGFDEVNEWAGEWGRTESDVLGPEARAWLNALPEDRTFFLHLQFLDNHYPFLPREEFRDAFIDPDDYPWSVTTAGEEEVLAAFPTFAPDVQASAVEWLRGLYDAETLAEDAELELTLASLADAGRLDDTLLVVIADHGETIGDADTAQFGHGESLREELVHIPLLLYHPRLEPGVVTETLRGTDVLPTILDALGLEIPPDLDGVVVRPGRGAPFAYGALFPNDGDLRVTQAYAAREGIKILRDCARKEDRAFDLVADPWEIAPIGDLVALPGATELRDEMDLAIRSLQEDDARYAPCVR